MFFRIRAPVNTLGFGTWPELTKILEREMGMGKINPSCCCGETETMLLTVPWLQWGSTGCWNMSSLIYVEMCHCINLVFGFCSYTHILCFLAVAGNVTMSLLFLTEDTIFLKNLFPSFTSSNMLLVMPLTMKLSLMNDSDLWIRTKLSKRTPSSSAQWMFLKTWEMRE